MWTFPSSRAGLDMADLRTQSANTEYHLISTPRSVTSLYIPAHSGRPVMWAAFLGPSSRGTGAGPEHWRTRPAPPRSCLRCSAPRHPLAGRYVAYTAKNTAVKKLLVVTSWQDKLPFPAPVLEPLRWSITHSTWRSAGAAGMKP